MEGRERHRLRQSGPFDSQPWAAFFFTEEQLHHSEALGLEPLRAGTVGAGGVDFPTLVFGKHHVWDGGPGTGWRLEDPTAVVVKGTEGGVRRLVHIRA